MNKLVKKAIQLAVAILVVAALGATPALASGLFGSVPIDMSL